MSFTPDDAFKGKEGINLAPMIDFLFLMLMFFACMAVSRATSKDTDIELVEVHSDTTTSAIADADTKIINIEIDEFGEYTWRTELHDYAMNSAEDIAKELRQQYENGLLPANKNQTQILLKIDRDATWEPILNVIFAIRDAGFSVRPVYEPTEK